MDEAGQIQAARAGDELAFDSVIGPLIDPAYKLALVLLRDPDEAEDAVQEATLKGWRKLHQLHEDASVRSWFLSIVANQCRTMRRSRWWSVVRLDTITRTQPDISQGLDRKIDLDRELARLPMTDRAVLFLHFYLDLPFADVGRILGITAQAAKSRVHRAVTRLRLGMVEVGS